MFDYLIVSTAVTDDIYLPQEDYSGSYLGGAGIYALAGISLWTRNALLLTGVGSDFFKRYQQWFTKNQLCMDGLYIASPLTPRTNVFYLPDGSREEVSCFGADHYTKMEPSAQQILQYASACKGVYLFKDTSIHFWNELLTGKQIHNFILEWEINADSAIKSNYSTVKQIAEQCDIFSINRQEAHSLFGIDDFDCIVSLLCDWDVPMIFLRLGKDGSLIIRNHRFTIVPSISLESVVDQTGAGNASSAAVLYGYCEGFSEYDCGIMGSISASKNIEQFGPPEHIDLLKYEQHHIFSTTD